MAKLELKLWPVRVPSLSLYLFGIVLGVRAEFWAVVRLRKWQKKGAVLYFEQETAV